MNDTAIFPPRPSFWQSMQRRLRRDRRGSIALITGMSAPMMIGLLAVSIDGAMWEGNHVALQGSADQAALAAGLAKQLGGSIIAEARGVAATHGFVHGQGGVTVTVNQPPTAGTYQGNINAIEVVVAQPQARAFSGIYSQTTRTISGRSVAAPTGPGAATSMCLMALKTTGTSIVFDGQGTVTLNGCDVYDNSAAAVSLRLIGNVTMSSRNYLMVGGWAKESQSKLLASGAIKTYGASAADPYAARVIPAFSGCNYSNGSVIKSNKTFNAVGSTPYVICNGLSFSDNGTLTFGPGVYIFDRGNLNFEGNWTVNATGGVTIIMSTSTGTGIGKFKAISTFRLNLTAPSTGPTAGMAIWVDKRATGADGVWFQDSMTLTIKGAVYAPANAVTYKGDTTSPCTQIVAGSIHFIDTSKMNHDCVGVGTVDPAGPPAAMALVE